MKYNLNIHSTEYPTNYMPGYGDTIPSSDSTTDDISTIPSNSQPTITAPSNMPQNNNIPSTSPNTPPTNNTPSISPNTPPTNNTPSMSPNTPPINNTSSLNNTISSPLNDEETYILFLYPKEARVIQKSVNSKLNTLDYEGSIIFHEYPDKEALQDIINDINVPYDLTKIDPNWLRELIQVIFIYEMYKRRASNPNKIV